MEQRQRQQQAVFARDFMASIEATAEATILRLDRRTTFGAPVVPPVGSNAAIRSSASDAEGSRNRWRQFGSGFISSSSKATRPSSGRTTMRLRLGAEANRLCAFS